MLAQLLATNKRSEIPNGVYLLASFAVASAIAINHLIGEIDRLHHDFLGILLQMFPINSVRILGIMYTLDSMMYIIDPNRQYDFANIVVDHSAIVVTFLFGTMLLQFANWLLVKFLKLSKRTGSYIPINANLTDSSNEHFDGVIDDVSGFSTSLYGNGGANGDAVYYGGDYSPSNSD